MLPGSGAPVDSRIGAFAVDPALNLQQVSGTVTDYLGCDAADLLGYGWRPFLHHPDQSDLARMAHDLQLSRPGQYDLVAQARTGDPILYLRLRTLVVLAADRSPTAQGRIDLRHVESRRAVRSS